MSNLVEEDISISFSTTDIGKPQVVLSTNPEFPGEVAALVTFIPQIGLPSEEGELGDMAPGEFIFLLDRSGSMSGQNIKTAVEALILFL